MLALDDQERKSDAGALEPPVRAAHMEEIRFWKRQQWAVAGYAIALIAGAFHMTQSVQQPLGFYEKVVASFLVFLIARGGGRLIWELQESLKKTRKVLDQEDPDPERGMHIVEGLWVGLAISAFAVVYSFWR
jgi:hypothetical protein